MPLLNAASIEKFNVSGVSARDRAEIVDILSRFDDLTLTSSLEGNLEITAAGVSKASARVWLAHVWGGPCLRRCRLRNSGNSIGMLRWAGMAYAMGNGTEKAKVATRSIAGSNANDGVAIALRSMMSRGEPWSVPQSERRPHCRDVPWTQEPAR